MKNIIIDSHTHVYPPLSKNLEDALKNAPFDIKNLIHLFEKIESNAFILKKIIRPKVLGKLKYVHDLAHQTRKLPAKYIDYSDRMQSLLWSIGLILEGKISDLEDQMNNNGVNYSIVIAHPPIISNEYILQLANNFSRIIPIVNVSPCKSSKEVLEHYIRLGAKGLKIHAASDGLDAFDQHYINLLEVANKNRLPVIVHTGCLNISPVYKDPNMGHAEHFESWFKNYPNVKFILAHMNIHFPQVAIDLCKEYKNVYTDTSWQPKEAILKAVKELGANKIMFGTDWPIIGNNIENGLNIINKLLSEKLITTQQANRIKGLNAAKIFGIEL